eukprot:4517550-Prymnesium_polylepis.1
MRRTLRPANPRWSRTIGKHLECVRGKRAVTGVCVRVTRRKTTFGTKRVLQMALRREKRRPAPARPIHAP